MISKIKYPFLLFFLHLQICHASIERGQELYSQICVNCHGPNLDGGIGPSLADSYWKNGDSAESIQKSIAKGITGTEMIAYELVYPEKDIKALTDFILSKQEGNRETLRSTYPRDYSKGKDLTLNSLIQSNQPPNLDCLKISTMSKECLMEFFAGSPNSTSRNQVNSNLILEVKAEHPSGLMGMKFITVMTKLPNPLISIRSLN